MNIAEAIMWGQYSVLTIMLVCGPVLLAAMVVGFMISLMQAVTQIQEMTLVFVPKILVVMLVTVLLGGWMLEQAVVFGQRCFSSAAVVDSE
ncbi:MAG: flagellar biosynthetic protein FliQ [Myxococcota bacterium]|nr:flagellar biosynthetic protein FliQ [Myxococcota bacterium]MEC8425217.1 flagellar biosynthetic protein FliQ [Myxococcota bacterium]